MTRTFLSTAEQRTILLQREVDLNQIRTRQELHDHSTRYDRRNTQLHQRPTVRGQDDTHPVEGVGGVRRHDTVEGYLRANQENEEGDGGP